MKTTTFRTAAMAGLCLASASAQDAPAGAVAPGATAATSDNVDASAFVPVADVMSGIDVSRKLQVAIDEARKLRKAVYLPNVGPCYIVNTTIDPSDVELFGTGTCITTTANVDTIRTDKFGTNVHDLKFTHSGAAGRVANFIQGEGNQFWRNRVVATNPDNVDPIVFFALSNNRIKDNSFTN